MTIWFRIFTIAWVIGVLFGVSSAARADDSQPVFLSEQKTLQGLSEASRNMLFGVDEANFKYMNEHKDEIKCTGYLDNSRGKDYTTFCYMNRIGVTDLFQGYANCTKKVSYSKKPQKFIGIVTCSLGECGAGPDVCKGAEIDKSKFDILKNARKEKYHREGTFKSDSEAGAARE